MRDLQHGCLNNRYWVNKLTNLQHGYLNNLQVKRIGFPVIKLAMYIVTCKYNMTCKWYCDELNLN